MSEEDELEDTSEEEEEPLKSIDIGDQLPSITLKNEKGEDLDIGRLADEQGVILFLVPKADTRMSVSWCDVDVCSTANSGLHPTSLRLPRCI